MKTPTKWGICMEGNAQPFAEALDLLIRRRPAKEKRPFTYLEIGVGEGGTLAAVVELLKQYDGLNWSVTGVDIPAGWSYNEAAVKRNVNGVRLPMASQIVSGSASVYLVPSHKFLTEVWDWPVDFAFVDGCHGKSCVKGDFIGLARHIRRGGIVCFHDASPKCQGYHPQPHCGTGIVVREALQELGLLEDRLPCWRLWREVDADHGCAFFQFVGYDKVKIPAVPPPKESQGDPLLGNPG